MPAEPSTTTTRRTNTLAACAVLIIVALLMTAWLTNSDTSTTAEGLDDWSAAAPVCAGIGDVYLLTEPGSYSTFASTPSDQAVVEVRGTHGEMLATSPATIANPAAIDLLTGARFDVAPPPVFDVVSNVLIHVRHDGSPYELVVVRTNGSQTWSGHDIHPPVEATTNEPDSCLTGNHAATLRIHTDAAYSDVDARQVFRIASPEPANISSQRSLSTSADTANHPNLTAANLRLPISSLPVADRPNQHAGDTETDDPSTR